jgi:hypothetical protein
MVATEAVSGGIASRPVPRFNGASPTNRHRQAMNSLRSLTLIEKEFLTVLAQKKTYISKTRRFRSDWKTLVDLGLATATASVGEEIYEITPAGQAAARESDPRFLPNGRRHASTAP